MSQEIISHWDAASRRGQFPLMHTDSYWVYGKSRLTVFRSPDEWITVFELFTYYFGLGDTDVLTMAYGNHLKQEGFQQYPTGAIDWGIHVPPAEPDSPDEDEWTQDLFKYRVSLNSAVQTCTATPSDYLNARIDLASKLSDDPLTDTLIKVFRLIAHRVPSAQCFHPQDLLLRAVGRQNVPLFLQLDDWCHPGTQGINLPSASPCLRSLADAISIGSHEAYTCKPELFNTHWSHWPNLLV